ncbi:hypothetical protein [Pseudoxanthomonas sp.]|uniref:hypothetical protein n=1 Tax=Pseudoxanthomonas sp. TaxID=1871049 RepID=UPI00262293A6|nr:hypothetical protein [Pseudoxanthomonas sp.]WDS35869.1 MAG: hypothetical protein O8I58_16365 [Pseudoxanthomonas sp.]
MLGRRPWVSVLLLPLVFLVACPLAAQQVASDTPQAWQADAKANKHAQKAAEKAAKAGMPKMKSAGKPSGGEGGPPGGGGSGGGMDGGSPPGGGEGGPPGGGHDGPPGGGQGGRSQAGADAMLRPEMDFAAPLKGTLVLYRSREAVIFGSTESSDVTILPLSGEGVSIAPGVLASVHDDAGALRVDIVTTNDIHVTFRYHTDAGVLTVVAHAEGPFPRPGSRFDVQRQYRLAR